MIYYILSLINLFNIQWNTIEVLIVRTILATLTSFLICLISCPWVIRTLALLQLKQHIRKEGPKSHQKKEGTPTMGGLLIILSACTSTIIWVDIKNFLIWIVLFATISFGIIGFIDDYMMQIKKHNTGLNPKQKLVLQIIVATFIIWLIFLMPDMNQNITIPFLANKIFNLGYLYIPFCLLIIVGTSNAVNLTDGLDGMAIGTTIIAKTIYMLIALIAGYPIISSSSGFNYDIPGSKDLAIYCGAFIGSGLGFLWYNSYPAQIFMGDVGSLSIGSSIATVAILLKHEILLILIGGIFLLETLSVILQVGFFKITKGKRLFKMAPIHHHFELDGISEPKIVIRFYIIGIILALLSVLYIKL